MRRTWIVLGSALLAVALVTPPVAPLVPDARAATTQRPCSEQARSSALSSPTATWTLAPTGPKLLWQRATFAPTVCQLIAFGGNDPMRGMYNDTWLFEPG